MLQLTKVVTAVTIVSLGDMTCQKLEKGSAMAPLDLRRTARMAAWTALITPLIHRWYNLLLATFPTSPLGRMAADQIIFAPTSLAGFLCAISLMEHGTGTEGIAAAKAKLTQFFPILKANYVCWPLIMFFNFKLVPPQLNLPVVNAASFFWSIYLSFAANKKGHTHLVDEMLESGPPYGPGREVPLPGTAFADRVSPKPVLAEGVEMRRLHHDQDHHDGHQHGGQSMDGAGMPLPQPVAASGARASDTAAVLRPRAAGSASTGGATAAAEHLPDDPADPELGAAAAAGRGGSAAK